jgi:hypothetical protein
MGPRLVEVPHKGRFSSSRKNPSQRKASAPNVGEPYKWANAKMNLQAYKISTWDWHYWNYHEHPKAWLLSGSPYSSKTRAFTFTGGKYMPKGPPSLYNELEPPDTDTEHSDFHILS